MARAALLLAVLATSWGSILARLAAAPPPLTIASGRLLCATLLVAPWGAAGLGRPRPGGRTLLLSGLAGAGFAAAYLIVGRAVRARVGFGAYLLLVNLSGAICAALLAAARGHPAAPVTRRDLGLVILMGLVPHLLGHGSLNWAVRRLRAYVVNLAALGEPVLASVYAWILFREAPPAAVYPGALLIAAGVALALRGGPPERGGGAL